LPQTGVLKTLPYGISQSPWHCLFQVPRFGQASQVAVEIAPSKARQISPQHFRQSTFFRERDFFRALLPRFMLRSPKINAPHRANSRATPFFNG